MNANIKTYNDGKYHKPILKVRVFELGSKFSLGNSGNKKDKYVEAAKGANLYFAIYQKEDGQRSFETIPLNLVIERLKQGLNEVPEENEKGEKLLFHLSPNDLVIVANEDGISNEIYKMVSSSGSQCFFVPYYIASPIVQTIELGANNKSEKAWSGIMIKQACQKLRVSRLGFITN